MKTPKIVILCGGKGVRLKPITNDIPKPLVEIDGKPILHQAVNLYSNKGFNDFIFCIGYKGSLIKNYFNKFSNYNIQYSDSGEEATMLKRIYDIKDLIEDKIIVAYGDTYADIDFKKLLESHNSSDALMTIVASSVQSPFGLINIKKDNKIIEFKEKPKLNYYMGYSIIEKEAFNYITKDLLNTKGEEGWTLFFQKIISMGKMRAYYHEGLNITFNTHSQKKIADNIFKYYTYWGENEE
ncbi:nucleotidyltransferase family protein [Candidatus Woesearchaeota archaeon]|nr:nucleotidyltransferase family protein [Candidatus Woesearchaeota archaeon]